LLITQTAQLRLFKKATPRLILFIFTTWSKADDPVNNQGETAIEAA